MRKIGVISCLVSIALLGVMCHKPDAAYLEDDSHFDPRLSGGYATVFDAGAHAFSHPVPGLSSWDEHIHELGDKIFEQTFVAAPAPLYGGLGPAFNNVSCVSCHHNDGKGIPTAGQVNSSLLFRLSIVGSDAHGGALSVPGMGTQLQDVALQGVLPEARVNISYKEQVINYLDGNKAVLRNPVYTLYSPYVPLPAQYMLSPRLAPSVFGLGLLNNISEATLLSFADPDDKDKDGISGRPNYVYNPYTHKIEVGRFGLKANTSSLLVQVATAFQQDMGITNYVQPAESVHGQIQMNNLPVYAGYDLSDSLLNAVFFYTKSLAVPARRDVENMTVKEGALLFKQLNCSGCHIPTMYTEVDVTFPAISHQRIHPYTDLLLHDMGDGLADKRPDYLATGSEWRTAPLWGVGLFDKTNGVPYYLHDGRARTLEEAILWHGGEAEKAKNKFMQLSKTERDALIIFLKSL